MYRVPLPSTLGFGYSIMSGSFSVTFFRNFIFFFFFMWNLNNILFLLAFFFWYIDHLMRKKLQLYEAAIRDEDVYIGPCLWIKSQIIYFIILISWISSSFSLVFLEFLSPYTPLFSFPWIFIFTSCIVVFLYIKLWNFYCYYFLNFLIS